MTDTAPADTASPNPAQLAVATEGIPEAEQFGFWRDLNQPGFEMSPIGEHPAALDASVDIWPAGACSFADMRFLPGERHRHLIDIASSAAEVLVVRYIRKGGQHGLLDGEPVRLDTGEIHVYPFGSAFQFVSGDLEQVSAYVPFETIGYDPSSAAKHRVFGAEDPTGRVLRSALACAIDGLRRGETSAGQTAADFSQTLGTAINSGRRQSASRAVFEQARSHAFRSFIRENVFNPELDSKMVCEAFGASRATIYREFAEDGGIGRYILSQRLHRAMLRLASEPIARGDVGRVALSSGFKDTSHFSKVFRKAYGASAMDFLQNPEMRRETLTRSRAAAETGLWASPVRLDDIFIP